MPARAMYSYVVTSDIVRGTDEASMCRYLRMLGHIHMIPEYSIGLFRLLVYRYGFSFKPF